MSTTLPTSLGKAGRTLLKGEEDEEQQHEEDGGELGRRGYYGLNVELRNPKNLFTTDHIFCIFCFEVLAQKDFKKLDFS